MQALIARVVAVVRAFLKREPALTVGSITSVLAVFVTWVQTNHITSWRQAVAVAGPIVVTWIIRNFVTPNATVTRLVAEGAEAAANTRAAADQTAVATKFGSAAVLNESPAPPSA